ncbi:Cactin [Lamellibrachia satsuma]|nr:Cactin [Lamellibrachia satsuma]
MGREEHKRKHKSRSLSRDRHKSKKKRSEHGKRSRSHSKDRHKNRSYSRDRHRSRSRSREKTRQPDSAPLTEEEKRKEKQLMKMLETPQEKLARRLAKKERKDKVRRTQMGWDAEYLGYTNSDNPFGDDHLLNTFVWGKKLEKEGKKDFGQEELEKHQRKKMIESKIELEKVKKRRLEREKEWEEREKEREFMQRNKESEYFREWEEQEDTFHLQQAKLRSKIRIADGRAKPIDLLAQYISAEDDELAIEMHEPYTCLNGLTLADLEDLLEDITVYTEMEQGLNANYWRDITIITEDECENLRKLDQNSREYVGERRSGINPSVVDDVVNIFKGKTLAQLKGLQQSIQAKLDGGEGVDVGYWESLLQQLKVHMAKTRLREMHEQQLRRKLFKLKQEQCIEPSAPLFPIVKSKADVAETAASENQSPEVTNDSTSDDTAVKVEPQPGTSADGIKMEKHDEEKHSEEEEYVLVSLFQWVGR